MLMCVCTSCPTREAKAMISRIFILSNHDLQLGKVVLLTFRTYVHKLSMHWALNMCTINMCTYLSSTNYTSRSQIVHIHKVPQQFCGEEAISCDSMI